MNESTGKQICTSIQDRLTLYLLGDLDSATQATIAQHLETCEECGQMEAVLAPTLSDLRDALQDESSVPKTLSSSHRQHVYQSLRKKIRRKPVILRFHVLEMAAVLIGAVLIIGFLMPATFSSRKDAAMLATQHYRVPKGEAETIALDVSDDLDSTRRKSLFFSEIDALEVDPPSALSQPAREAGQFANVADGTPAVTEGQEFELLEEISELEAPDMPLEDGASALDRLLEKTADRDSRELLSGTASELRSPSPPAATPAVPKPLEFDSVAMVKSPVVMSGVYGARSGRQEAQEQADAAKKFRMKAKQLTLGGGMPLQDHIAAPVSRAINGERVEPSHDHNGNERIADVLDAEDKNVAFEASFRYDAPVDTSVVVGNDGAGDGIERGEAVDAKRERGRSAKQMVSKEPHERKGAEVDKGLGHVFGSDTHTKQKQLKSQEEETFAFALSGKKQAVLDETMKRDVQSVAGFAKKVLVPGGSIESADVSADDAVNEPFEPRFEPAGFNPLVKVRQQPFSTFSIDVDTASYTVARNYMFGGHLPPPEAVRTEEFVNFFDYAYKPPVGQTFKVDTEIAPSKFGRGMKLLKLGVKGRRLGREEQRQASLTVLVDSSGSMNQPDRLGLVQRSLALLLDELNEQDQIAIIQFDNQSRLILAHTPVSERETILKALNAIQCGGGTNLEKGLSQAYEQAAKAFVSRGENRILLMSDGVVNLGETESETIAKQIEANRRQGVYLSVFGFGMGIYDDAMLKKLAFKGNGAYAFIDSETEARRVFVDDLSATLNTIAEDVKIQIEFNPARVANYRQLGYESRQLTKEQFRDDSVDAGEVGSGQSVTALYELSLADIKTPYNGPVAGCMVAPQNDWLAIARVRYRRVDTGKIEEIEERVTMADVLPTFEAASVRFRLAAGVAAFAEILRGSPYMNGIGFDEVAKVLRPVALDLHLDKRIREVVQLVETANGLAR